MKEKIYEKIDLTEIIPGDISVDDLVAQAQDRNRQYLLKSSPYGWLEHFEKMNPKKLLEIVYNEYSMYADVVGLFRRRGSAFYTYKRPSGVMEEAGDVPCLIRIPRRTIVCWTILTIIASWITYISLSLMFNPSTSRDGLVGAWALLATAAATFIPLSIKIYREIRNRNKDLKLVDEIRAHIARLWENFESAQVEFKNKLDTDPVFYLEHIIAELGHVKDTHKSEFYQEKFKLNDLIYRPVKSMEDQIDDIKDQLKNVWKLKSAMSEVDYVAKKDEMRKKIWELKKTIEGMSRDYQAAEIQCKAFDDSITTFEKIIKIIKGQRTALMNQSQLMAQINRSLKDNPISIDEVTKRLYEDQFAKCLLRINELRNSLTQISKLANDAIERLVKPKNQAAA